MSRYSFIDENINMSGKQCFCIDVNSSNSPFIIGGNQSTQPEPQSPKSTQVPLTHTLAHTPAPAPVPVGGVGSGVVDHVGIGGYENKKSSLQSLGSDYLLTPNVIDSKPSKEQEMIKTVNTLLTQVYSNVQKDFLGSNAAEIDIPKNSLTQENSGADKSKSKINLNTMANDKQVGKKTYRKSASNLNLFEGFEQSGCTDVCKGKKYARVGASKVRKSDAKSNENIYLLVIIALFLLVSWFKK